MPLVQIKYALLHCCITLEAYSPFGSGGHGSEEILKGGFLCEPSILILHSKASIVPGWQGNLTTNIGKTHGKSAAQVLCCYA